MCRKTLNRQSQLMKAINRKMDLRRDPTRARNWCLLLLGVGMMMFAAGPTSIITVVAMVAFTLIFLRLTWVLQRWHLNGTRRADWRRLHVL